MKRPAIFLLAFLSLTAAVALAGGKDKFCDVTFTVTKDGSGKPVKYANVILHAVDEKGRQRHEGIQVKTDGEGHAQASGVPYGKVRIQVIATGLQTFGEDYELNEPVKEIAIKLKQPQGQYSIYK